MRISVYKFRNIAGNPDVFEQFKATEYIDTKGNTTGSIRYTACIVD